MAIAQEEMNTISKTLFLPIMLVLDAWLFQYLVLVYYSRWRDVHVCSLLFASLLAFVTHVYFHPDLDVMSALNGVSETSLQLTFLIQITIIGRAVNRKVKLRSIARLTYAAEVLILLGWLHVFVSVLGAAGVGTHDRMNLIGNVLESVSLMFVLIFRFFYLSLSGGWNCVFQEKKLELLLYILFALHEVPFVILEHQTRVTTEFAQGICNRLIIMACILLNIHKKTRPASRNSYSATAKRDSVGNVRGGSVASSRGSVIKIPIAGFSVERSNSLVSSRANLGTVRRSSNQTAQAFPDIAKIAVTSAQQTEVGILA